MSQKPAAKRRQRSPALYTTEPVRGRVIARHIDGESNRRIANEEKIDRETVSRILSQPEVADLTARYRSQLLGKVPKALGVYDEALDGDDPRRSFAAATKILEWCQVFPKDGIEQCLPELDREQKRLLVYGQMMEMIMNKAVRYGMALPPEYSQLLESLKGLLSSSKTTNSKTSTE
jgi:hypothetical protein